MKSLTQLTCEQHALALEYDSLMGSGQWDRAATVMLRFAEVGDEIKLERLRLAAAAEAYRQRSPVAEA